MAAVSSDQLLLRTSPWFWNLGAGNGIPSSPPDHQASRPPVAWRYNRVSNPDDASEVTPTTTTTGPQLQQSSRFLLLRLLTANRSGIVRQYIPPAPLPSLTLASFPSPGPSLVGTCYAHKKPDLLQIDVSGRTLYRGRVVRRPFWVCFPVCSMKNSCQLVHPSSPLPRGRFSPGPVRYCHRRAGVQLHRNLGGRGYS